MYDSKIVTTTVWQPRIFLATRGCRTIFSANKRFCLIFLPSHWVWSFWIEPQNCMGHSAEAAMFLFPVTQRLLVRLASATVGSIRW